MTHQRTSKSFEITRKVSQFLAPKPFFSNNSLFHNTSLFVAEVSIVKRTCQIFHVEVSNRVCGSTCRGSGMSTSPTHLPSLRHCDGADLSLVESWEEGEGSSRKEGFSSLSSRRSLMIGRYVPPSRPCQRSTRRDSGRPFNRDSTTPAYNTTHSRDSTMSQSFEIFIWS